MGEKMFCAENTMFQICKEENNYGVCAQQIFRKGDILILLKGILRPFNNRYSIQINAHQHLHPFEEEEDVMKALLWPYLNHSCNPNSYVDLKTLHLKASRDISPGEEITLDYEQTEWEMKNPFTCICNSDNCRRKIVGKSSCG